MFRVVSSKLMKHDDTGDLYHIDAACLSTDTKPTSGFVTGSGCYEVDTGNVYLYDEVSSSWIKQ